MPPRFACAGPATTLRLARRVVGRILEGMKVADLKDVMERQPFRPFAVRLNNGMQYTFKQPRDLGAPKDYHLLVFFGESQMVLIDSESIAEIIQE